MKIENDIEIISLSDERRESSRKRNFTSALIRLPFEQSIESIEYNQIVLPPAAYRIHSLQWFSRIVSRAIDFKHFT